MPRKLAWNSGGGLREAPRSATKRFRDRSPDDAWSSAYKRSREKSLDTLWSSSNGADRLQLQFDAAVPDSHGAQLKGLAVEQHDAEDSLVPEADESPTDAEAMEQRDLDRDLEELLTPVELRDVEELLMPEIDGAAPEERLRRALEIVGVGLLSEAAEKHPEAAFTAWMGRKHKSHPYRSQVYREKLQLFDKNARFARMANEMWNADRSMGEDLCRFNDLEDADEIDLYEWSPGGIVDWDGTDDDDVPMYSGPSPFDPQSPALVASC